MVELRVTGGDLGTHRMRAVLGQQAHAFALHPEVGAEVAAAFHDVFGGVVQIGRTRVLDLGRAVAGPGQAEVVAGHVVAGFLVHHFALALERLHVEGAHVAHVSLQALRALAGVADGPDRGVDFAQDVFHHGLVHALDLLHLVVLRQLFVEAQFLGELVHDHVVAAALPQRLDDFLAPLDRAVGRGTRPAGLELRGRRQQVHRTVGILVFRLAGHGRHGRRGRRIGINHHQQVELVHRTLHLQTTRLRVGCMAPEEHAAQVRALVDQFVLFQHTVDPARDGDAGLLHHAFGILLLDPLVVDAPGGGEVFP